MKRFTIKSVDRALHQVMGELEDLGLLTKKLWDVPVYTQPVPIGLYEGLYVEEPGLAMVLAGFRPRAIYLPLVSLSRLSHALFGQGMASPTCLRDVLRHELGHAFAVEHPSLVRRSARFRECFGGAYDQEGPTGPYDPHQHVTPYAATCPAEDFAEVFMIYCRCRGQVNRCRIGSSMFNKLRFIRWISHEVTRRGL